ncbi:calcium-activated potassium channel subunit alpha-1 [Thraustotheca clavata]|uniref:Calcium-activated potassium channel subunit alpha-1 n=1 Tax=Thraustotheca clavata TaxID=74557 RepID=A0A1V9Y6D9_9STRA|nr:calcium-activated potassium channel subunit alpha-1 [Thraustotheca clavata]
MTLGPQRRMTRRAAAVVQNNYTSKLTSTFHLDTSVLAGNTPQAHWILPRVHGEGFRAWCARNLEQSPLCRLSDAILVILSFVMVEFFMYTNWSGYNIDIEPAITNAGTAIGSLFTIDYALRLYAAPLRFEYVRSFFAIVDVVGICSTWIEFGLSMMQNDSNSQDIVLQLRASDVGRQFLSLLQVMKSMRILRAYRLLRFTSSIVQRQIMATILTVVCMIVALAGVLQILEVCPSTSMCAAPECSTNRTDICIQSCSHVQCCGACKDYRFFDWIYFTVVSISTVGYGDISPQTRMGRLGVATLIMLTFVLLPLQVNKLVSVISSHSDYSKAYNKTEESHAVITACDIDLNILSAFLRQFFHPDNRLWNEQIIILHPKEPTSEITRLIHMYEPRVTYIVGSAMRETDLRRASVHKSSMCYVFTCMNNQFEKTDQMSSILTNAFRSLNSKVPIFTQVILSRNISHCQISGADNVVCVEKLKMTLLAKSCDIMGLSTLISNLLDTIAIPSKRPDRSWVSGYLKGCTNKFFSVDIPRTYSGLTFSELVLFLFNNLQIIPLAMISDNLVKMMPMDFKLGTTADPNICCTLYVIAPSSETLDGISRYQHEEIRVFRQTLRKMERDRQLRAEKKLLELNLPPTANPTSVDSSAILRRQSRKVSTVPTQRAPGEHALHGPRISVYEQHPYDEFLDRELPEKLKDHIVIIGVPFALQDLLVPLHHSLSKSRIVIILAPKPLTKEQFYLNIHRHNFTNVYYCQGSPLSAEDLRRVRVSTASSVLVLTSAAGKKTFFDENMVDADAITCVRFILEICYTTGRIPPNLMVELVKHTNVKFLSSVAKAQSTQTRRISHLVPRSLSSADLLDDENEDEQDERLNEMEHLCQPAYASGRVYVSGLVESLMSECYQKPNLSNVLDALLHGTDHDVDRQCLFQLPCPTPLVGKSFGECFRKLLHVNYICIGCWHPEKSNENRIILSPAYVETNPESDTKMRELDRLYLIGRPIQEIPL